LSAITRSTLKRIKQYKIFLLIILTLFLVFPSDLSMPGLALAQDGDVEGPVYIVQEGDSLWDIALRFRVSVEELSRSNGIADPSQLSVGARLVIPGLEGVTGVLTTKTLPYGVSLRSLSRRYQTPVETIEKLNHLTSPSELYAGTTFVIPEEKSDSAGTSRAMLSPGQSLLELAVIKNENPWEYALTNNIPGTWSAMPNDVLHLPNGGQDEDAPEQPTALPEEIREIALKPQPFVQGKVAILHIDGVDGLEFSGALINNELHFFPDKEQGGYVSLQGIHAMTEPGLYPLTLTGVLPDETPFFFSQTVFVNTGSYPYDPVLTVSPETIDPAVTKPEDAQWSALAAPFTPEKLWEDIFQSPAPEPFSDCWPSLFGSRRSYNGSEYKYFHSGLDFCGGVGIEILAPARGKVVFAGPLTVRGNTTMIDHGWGVYTGYMHQSEIQVQVGDVVEPGQVIGLVGGTGRVTGPHLHWEVWAGGVQIDPLDWLEQSFP